MEPTIKPNELRLRFANNLEMIRATVAHFPPGRATALVVTKIDEAELWASKAMLPAEPMDTKGMGAPDDPRVRSA